MIPFKRFGLVALLLVVTLFVGFCVVPTQAETWESSTRWYNTETDETVFYVVNEITGPETLDAGDSEDYIIQFKLEDWNLPTTGIWGVSAYKIKIKLTADHSEFDPETYTQSLDTYGYGDLILVNFRETLHIRDDAIDDTVRMTVTFYYTIQYLGDVIKTEEITTTATIDVIGKGACLGTVLIVMIPLVSVVSLAVLNRRRK